VPKRREPSTSLVKSTVAAVPWMALTRAAMIVRRHWSSLSARERQHLTTLIGQSRGRASNLSEKQRAELRKLGRKLDLPSMGRELLALRGSRKRGRKRR
jgi:hypothetical protein